MELTNSLGGDYSDTVLVGTNATFQVSVKDADGNPVANQNVVVNFERDINNDLISTHQYNVPDSMAVVTTDAKGNATFVAKPGSGQTGEEINNVNSKFVGSYKYSVKAGDSTSEGVLRVASIVYGTSGNNSVDSLNKNWKDGYSPVPGTNVESDNWTAGRWTTDVNGKYLDYTGAQQVSIGDEHKVAFQTDVCLNLPAYSDGKTPAKEETQELKWKSGAYHTYESGTKDVTTHSADLLQDLSEVDYATVHFNSLNLSKHTKAVVSVVDSNWNETQIKTYGNDTTTYKDQNFSLQIPVSQLNNKKSIKITIESEGQVDLDNNVGYDVKDIVYVYKSRKTTSAAPIHWDGVNVTWEIEDSVYYDDEVAMRENGQNKALDVSTGEVNASGKAIYTDGTYITQWIVGKVKASSNDNSDADCYRITYSVPAFPRTGNAIIRCYDKNGNIKKYFACATINNGENKNVLFGNQYYTANDLLYEISEQEAKKSADCKITKDDGKGFVEVNATKSGIAHLKGTVSSDDPRIQEALDANNDRVYTSVMWNPVADNSNDVAGIAVAGQTITVVAQLIDNNDNPVAQSGQSVTWNTPTLNGVKKVDETTSTNANGQAFLRLSASKAAELIGVSAATNSGYQVALQLGGKASKKGADLYWVDLHLAYTSSVFDGKIYVDTTANGTAVGNAEANVGEKWEYASEVIAYAQENSRQFANGVLKGKTASVVSGVVPSANKKTSSKGTVTFEGGRANVTSDVAIGDGEGAVIFRLGSSNSPKEDATIKVGDDTYALIGTGSISANEILTLNYQFKRVGSAMSFVTPNGNISASVPLSATPDEQTIYLKLTDSKGNPVPATDVTAQRPVEVSVAATSHATLESNPAGYVNTVDADPAKTTPDKKKITFTSLSKVLPATDPNADGILAIKLVMALGTYEDVVVTAKYDNSVTTQSYSFINGSQITPFAFDTAQENGKNKIYYNSDAKEIVLAFTDEIYATSVMQKQFKVETAEGASIDWDSDPTTTQVIKDIAVEGSKVTIKLDGNLSDIKATTQFKVTIGATQVINNSVIYEFTSVDGQTLGDVNSVVFGLDRTASIAANYRADIATAIASPNGLTPALLAAAGIEGVVDVEEAVTEANLAAIKKALTEAGISAGTPLEDIQKLAKEALKDVKKDKEAFLGMVVPGAGFKGLKKANLKKAAARAIDPYIGFRNTGTVSGGALTVTVTSGSAIDLIDFYTGRDKDNVTALAAGTPFDLPAPDGSAVITTNLYFTPAAGTYTAVTGKDIVLTLESKYFTREYKIKDISIGYNADGAFVVTGGTIELGKIEAKPVPVA